MTVMLLGVDIPPAKSPYGYVCINCGRTVYQRTPPNKKTRCPHCKTGRLVKK